MVRVLGYTFQRIAMGAMKTGAYALVAALLKSEHTPLLLEMRLYHLGSGSERTWADGVNLALDSRCRRWSSK